MFLSASFFNADVRIVCVDARHITPDSRLRSGSLVKSARDAVATSHIRHYVCFPVAIHIHYVAIAIHVGRLMDGDNLSRDAYITLSQKRTHSHTKDTHARGSRFTQAN